MDDQEKTHRLLRNGEVTGCISSEDKPVQGCSVTPIGTMNYRMVATPQFVKMHFPQGFGKDCLKTAPAVIYNRRDALHSLFLYKYFQRSGESFHQKLRDIPIHYVPSSEKFVGMILDGHGYGMVPDLQGLAHIKTGQLMEMAPDTHLGVDLYWHRWNLSSLLLDEFSKTIVKNAVIC